MRVARKNSVTCSKCGKIDEKAPMVKCPICHKLVCDECRHNVSGRYFCSSHCADFFFFEEEE